MITSSKKSTGNDCGCASDGASSSRDLATLLVHERGRAHQALTEAILELRAVTEVAEVAGVQEAADRLLRLHAPWAMDLAGASSALIDAAGDERARRLFVAWSLRPNGRSQGQLGTEEGVTATRIGQIVDAAGRRVREALYAAPGHVQWTVRELRKRMGAVAPEGAVAACMASLGGDAEPADALLPWLAGPYQAVPGRPGWVAVRPVEVVRRTADALTADGGVPRLADIRAELDDLDICSDRMAEWLAVNGAVIIHDLAVVVRGRLSDALERILDAHGEPRTVEDLAAHLGTGGRSVEESTLVAVLRDRRFGRTSSGGVRLAAWADEARHPAPRKAKSKRAPGGTPGCPAVSSRGNQTEDVLAQVHASDPQSRVPPSDPMAPEARTVPDRLWLWVKVDGGVLRGSGGAVPPALVEGLGLEPPARRTFAGRWGPVTLAHDGAQPARGSVRAVALAVGARVGDTLLLGFSRRGDVEVEVRAGAVTAGATAPGAMPDAVTGIVPMADREDATFAGPAAATTSTRSAPAEAGTEALSLLETAGIGAQ